MFELLRMAALRLGLGVRVADEPGMVTGPRNSCGITGSGLGSVAVRIAPDQCDKESLHGFCSVGYDRPQSWTTQVQGGMEEIDARLVYRVEFVFK